MKKRKTYFGAILLTLSAIALATLVQSLELSSKERKMAPTIVSIQAPEIRFPDSDDETEEIIPAIEFDPSRKRTGPKPPTSEDTSLEAAIQQVTSLIRNDEFETASSVLEQLLVTHREDARVHFYRGLTLSKAGDDAQAIESYRRATKIFPHYQGALFNLGRLLRKAGDNEKAIETFTDLLQIAEPIVQAKAYALRAHIHRSNGDYLEAIDDYKRSLEIRPDSLSTSRFLAVSYSRIPDMWENAYETVTRAMASNPEYRLGILLRARLLWQRGLLENAAEEFQRLQKIEGPRSNRLWELALIEHQMGYPVRAKSRLKELAQQTSSTHRKRLLRGAIQWVEGAPFRALQTVREIDPTKIDSEKLTYLEGNLFLEMGDLDLATNSFGSISETWLYDSSLTTALAEIAVRMKSSEADTRTLRLVQQSPLLPSSWELRAQHLAGSGNIPGALRTYERLAEIRPNEATYTQALNWMLETKLYAEASIWIDAAKEAFEASKAIALIEARFNLQIGNLEQAETQLRDLANRHPGDGEVAGAFALIYIETERFEDALTKLDQAINYRPDSTRLRFQRAQVLQKLNKADEALHEVQKVLALKPNHVGAHELITKFQLSHSN